MFAGEIVECDLQFANDSDIPIEFFDMEISYLTKPVNGTVLDVR